MVYFMEFNAPLTVVKLYWARLSLTVVKFYRTGLSAVCVFVHCEVLHRLSTIVKLYLYSITTLSTVLRFYGPVNPMESCRARLVYLATRLLGRLSPLSG